MDTDPVNHPKHYTSDPSGVECIQITRHRNFNVGNAIKYLWRAGLKDQDTTVQDLRKAIWYIEDEIKRLESPVTPNKPDADELGQATPGVVLRAGQTYLFGPMGSPLRGGHAGNSRAYGRYQDGEDRGA